MGDVGSVRLACGWGQEKVGVHLDKFSGVTRDCCAQMGHGWSKGLEVHDPQGGMRRCGHRGRSQEPAEELPENLSA